MARAGAATRGGGCCRSRPGRRRTGRPGRGRPRAAASSTRPGRPRAGRGWRAPSGRPPTGAGSASSPAPEGSTRRRGPPTGWARRRCGPTWRRCGEDCAPVTVWSYVADLAVVLGALAPEGDWGPLRRLAGRLRARMRPSVDRARLVVPVGRLYAEGLAQMAEAPRPPAPAAPRPGANRRLEREVAYRDGLLLALLAACPLAAAQPRPARGRAAPGAAPGRVPAAARARRRRRTGPRTRRRCRPRWRPGSTATWARCGRGCWAGAPRARLWVSRDGTAMTVNSLARRVEAVTERRLGRRMGPHLFRHCAATSLALEAPEEAGSIAALLGHQGPAHRRAVLQPGAGLGRGGGLPGAAGGAAPAAAGGRAGPPGGSGVAGRRRRRRGGAAAWDGPEGSAAGPVSAQIYSGRSFGAEIKISAPGPRCRKNSRLLRAELATASACPARTLLTCPTSSGCAQRRLECPGLLPLVPRPDRGSGKGRRSPHHPCRAPGRGAPPQGTAKPGGTVRYRRHPAPESARAVERARARPVLAQGCFLTCRSGRPWWAAPLFQPDGSSRNNPALRPSSEPRANDRPPWPSCHGPGGSPPRPSSNTLGKQDHDQTPPGPPRPAGPRPAAGRPRRDRPGPRRPLRPGLDQRRQGVGPAVLPRRDQEAAARRRDDLRQPRLLGPARGLPRGPVLEGQDPVRADRRGQPRPAARQPRAAVGPVQRGEVRRRVREARHDPRAERRRPARRPPRLGGEHRRLARLGARPRATSAPSSSAGSGPGTSSTPSSARSRTSSSRAWRRTAATTSTR